MTTIIPTDITQEMKRSYLDYAMSVIVARALPDVRDGLKPVQRRIIYTMHKLGLSSTSRYSKSAKVVGEVLGKYHPHGDSPVYEAMVRMAQEFSMRNPLIKGQGNFGSIDGDPPAAMRYTEAKLAKISDELLADLHKNTVQFRDNFDATLQEPDCLPAMIPNLLVNGSEGIAVGMATKIPPHNLKELLQGLLLMLEKPVYSTQVSLDEAAKSVGFNVTLEELMQFIKGPDFPTGGHVYSKKDIYQAYLTGRNSLLMRGVAKIEEIGKGKEAIIITELPYQVNKATLVQKIASLVQDKNIVGISDLRDESDRRGIRVVVELKRDAVAKKILNNLFLKTQLQNTFPVNIVALVEGVPQTLSLKTILELFLRHRSHVVIARTRFDLEQAKHQAHILEGLLIAIDNIDEVVEIIKKSASESIAKERLIARFKLSEIQTQAILDMQLKKLTGLEKDKLQQQLLELRKEITRLEKILSSLANIFAEIKKEFLLLMEKYKEGRRTKVIASRPGEFSEEELIENKDTYILLTHNGYIKQLPKSVFKVQKRGGKGVSAIKTHEDDEVMKLEYCQTHDNLLFFTNQGRVFQLRAWEIPESSRQSKGKAIVNLVNLNGHEKITTFFPLNLEDSRDDRAFLFVTKHGVVKKTSLSEYNNIRANGLISIKLKSGDELISVEMVRKDNFVFLVSSGGKAITFNEKNVRSMGRMASGVRGIKLRAQEVVSSVSIVPLKTIENSFILIITKKGYGKLVKAKQFKSQNRGGIGIKAANITEKTGSIVFSSLIDNLESEMVLSSYSGQTVKVPVKSMPILSRNTQGVILMRFSQTKDGIAAATLI
ncbi:DNA gyrase subunit A [Candidatus Roizmanbacteria bacterium RIFOXYB2_FULL_41_10]|nr:MAG: DNA gyrase subunit A [Candidatus Roizmanbacteria bacterium RIFOXYB1_FULL_41_27]OGK70702.1 MAG: DNA gyrase subunit A [Candidatus Roizmanbacteria bacterium RIFOXYC1_FULL_41_16]OGK71598.1 MAG: DNA gyrase subunit A [Candidatus Roizmanbacteria bacterium RIFOXYB2_FULL_41_10]OGK74776.1 MAG: DNA gyrase subunit A [Candidatus Roizmanbacteria bacterium RIFOXYD1_FULL_41_24]